MSEYTKGLTAEQLIEYIANDYVELSHEKIVVQRNDFMVICREWLQENLSETCIKQKYYTDEHERSEKTIDFPRQWVDPAEGWKYGFPKIHVASQDGPLLEWLVKQGYPEDNLSFPIRTWEALEPSNGKKE